MTGTDAIIQEFLGIFRIEKTAYNEMLHLAEQKKEMIVQNRVEDLDSLVNKERQTFKKIQTLENRREAAVDKVAKALDVNRETITLDWLIQQTQGMLKQNLQSLKDELNTVIGELQQHNELNQSLINTQMEYNAFVLDLMTQVENAGNNYNQDGYVQSESGRRGFIDLKT